MSGTFILRAVDYPHSDTTSRQRQLLITMSTPKHAGATVTTKEPAGWFGDEVVLEHPPHSAGWGELAGKLRVGQHASDMHRTFGAWECIGIALTCLNSITAMSASLSLVLPSGGPVAMMYGLIVSAIGTLCMAASLAEICRVYPTAGGQYEWACECG